MIKSVQMLDVTTNADINCMSGCPSSATASASISLDDDVDPLFDNDWLHEHNLDILFDLFEEEMGTSTAKAGPFQDSAAFNNSSAFFGSSPVTSYLFGTSPSLASAIDLYDLLYFENQQPINNNNNSYTQSQSTTTTSTNNNNNINAPTTFNSTTTANNQTTTYSLNNVTKTSKSSQNHLTTKFSQHKSQNVSTNHIANSITNALKIKKRLKRSQNEGVSLLARPNLGNTNGRSSSSSDNSSCSSSSTNDNSININNSDKTSANITNLKTSGCIDIDQSQLRRNKDHCQNRCISGLAVIREHAYALRGH